MNGSTEKIASSLSAEIRHRSSAGSPPFLVAIDGKSGVGKSSVAKLLCRDLDAALVCGDDFYAGGTEIRHDSPEDLAAVCIDRSRLLSVLRDLKSGRAARFHPFDWDAFDGRVSKRQETISPRRLLVLEGVYANHPDFRPLIDCSVLLRISEAERQERLLKREGTITDWERQWHRAEDWYFDNLAPAEAFDIVLGDH